VSPSTLAESYYYSRLDSWQSEDSRRRIKDSHRQGGMSIVVIVDESRFEVTGRGICFEAAVVAAINDWEAAMARDHAENERLDRRFERERSVA